MPPCLCHLVVFRRHCICLVPLYQVLSAARVCISMRNIWPKVRSGRAGDVGGEHFAAEVRVPLQSSCSTSSCLESSGNSTSLQSPATTFVDQLFRRETPARSFSGGRWQLPTDLHRQKKDLRWRHQIFLRRIKPETKTDRINFEVVVRQQKKKHRSNLVKIEPRFYVGSIRWRHNVGWWHLSQMAKIGCWGLIQKDFNAKIPYATLSLNFRLAQNYQYLFRGDAVTHLLQAGELHANAKHHPDVTDDQVAQNLSVDCFVCPTVQDQMSSGVILGTLSAIKVNQLLF